jgi:hypothetical protein
MRKFPIEIPQNQNILNRELASELKRQGVYQGNSLFVYYNYDFELNNFIVDHRIYLRADIRLIEPLLLNECVDAFTTQELAMSFDPKEPDYLEGELLDQLSYSSKKLMYDTRAFWNVEFLASLLLSNLRIGTLRIDEVNQRLIDNNFCEAI